MTRDPDRTRTLLSTPPEDPALDAGLAAAFGPATAGWSAPPVLRDDSSDGPVVQPASPEMPRTASDRYQLLGEVARGGMGVILKGRDPRLGRDMAFKVLKTEHVGKPAAEQRFIEEAQVGGQLQHPGILPVYDLGRFDDGRPFFAMKLVKGRTLAAELADRPDPAADRSKFLQAFLKVCQAVAYAHGRGVIHRDLKPANVMVGDFGEVQVMDWGLAKVLPQGGIADEERAARADRNRPDTSAEPTVIRTARTGSGSETAAGSVLGTPAYMPPEQAGGEVDKLDERADVFGLGAMLCTILTGKPPYVARDAEAVRLMAVRGHLADAFARLDSCSADAELIALCKQCLSANRDDRPRDANVVARAVEAHLAEVEARAHRADVARAAAEAEARGERRRRRGQLALAAAVGLLLFGAGAAGWWAEEQKRTRRAAAERDVSRAVEEAVARHAQARGAGRDLALWAEARAAAVHAAERAVTADVPAEVRDRIRDLLAEIEQAERNRRLVAALLDIHAGMGDALTPGGDQDFAGADGRYARAFQEYGTDLFQLSPEQGADLLSGLGGDVRVELAAAIDDWGYVRFVRTQKYDDATRLFQVTRLLDPDALRNKIRDLVAARDHASLDRLAREIDPGPQPAQTVNLVAVYLYWTDPVKGPRAAGRFLGRAQPDHPADFQINHNLAFFLNKEGQWAEALPYCAAAVAVRPKSPAAWRDYAVALDGLGRTAEATDAFRRIVRLSPGATFAAVRARELATKSVGRPGDEQVRAARESARLDPKNPAAHRALAAVLVTHDDLDGAVAEYREALRLDPKDDTAHDGLWAAVVTRHIRLGKGADAAAVAAFGELTRLDPKDARAHIKLGLALARKGDRVGAADRFLEATRVDPTNAWAYRHLGDALAGKLDHEGAANAYRSAIRRDPNIADDHYKLGLALDRKGDWKGSAEAYREAARLDPKNPVYQTVLGHALGRTGDATGAISAFRAAAAADPNNPMHQRNVAFTLARTGDWPGVAAAYREAARLDPKRATDQSQLASALMRIGDLAGAVAAYRSAIQIGPEADNDHNRLAWILATGPDSVRDGKVAVEHATRACELNGWKNPAFIDTLAAACAEAGDFARAVEYQQKSLSHPAARRVDAAEGHRRIDLYTRKEPFRDAALVRRELGPPPREVKP